MKKLKLIKQQIIPKASILLQCQLTINHKNLNLQHVLEKQLFKIDKQKNSNYGELL
jgi:hypothetical protein